MLYEIFYRPFFNALIFIYQNASFHDFGIAIILVTIIVRLILFPLFHRSVKNQTKLQRLQPKAREIQELHKNDREKQTKALMELYKEHNVSPFSGFLLLLVQLPIFIGLYRVFAGKFDAGSFTALYSFVQNPGNINPTFLGLINLHQSSIVLVVLAALFQFLQGYLALPKTKPGEELSAAERSSRQMTFIMPVVTVLILWSFPSAIALYWTTTALFSILQQIIVNRGLEAQQENR